MRFFRRDLYLSKSFFGCTYSWGSLLGCLPWWNWELQHWGPFAGNWRLSSASGSTVWQYICGLSPKKKPGEVAAASPWCCYIRAGVALFVRGWHVIIDNRPSGNGSGHRWLRFWRVYGSACCLWGRHCCSLQPFCQCRMASRGYHVGIFNRVMPFCGCPAMRHHSSQFC